MPRVSVALPVYNGEPFLVQTLRDLQSQTEEDWEAVICDNASTDATPDLLVAASREDARIRLVRNERNLGALPNSNRAITLTEAPYVSLWGHDDRHHPDFLRALADRLDSAPDATLAYPASTLIGEDGAPFEWHEEARWFRDASDRIYDYDRGLERPLPPDPVARFRAVLTAGSIDSPIHGVFRRDALVSALPFTIHSSDRHALARVALQGPVLYAPLPLFAYRIHSKSTYFLESEEWVRRETGGTSSSRSGWRVLANYARLPVSAPLSVRERASSLAAVLGYAVRRRASQKKLNSANDAPSAERPNSSLEWSWLSNSNPDR